MNLNCNQAAAHPNYAPDCDTIFDKIYFTEQEYHTDNINNVLSGPRKSMYVNGNSSFLNDHFNKKYMIDNCATNSLISYNSLTINYSNKKNRI